MSLILQTPTERIDLGNPLEVMAALGDAARAAGDTEYPALWGITHTNDEMLSDEYLGAVRSEAGLLLNRRRDRLSPRAISLLEFLVTGR